MIDQLAENHVMVGTVLGSYRIVRKLGEGGMGAVWLAEHTLLGRAAAVKVLQPFFSQQPHIVKRFFNEARAATSIADPGIIQIFDFGNASDGSAYIVMEFLDGEALDARLRRLGSLAVGDALRIMRQVATSLAAAHARGIVHRDLKPENIFIVRDPEVAGGERTKILDFGIAKLVTDDQGARVKTQTAVVMGTPMYMSPEQCRGAGYVDERSDVYSLGCVLFHLLTGAPPFEAEGGGEVIAMHLREMAPLPSMRARHIPAAVDALVLRCLTKTPDTRIQSMTELSACIGAVLAELGPDELSGAGPSPQAMQGMSAAPTISGVDSMGPFNVFSREPRPTTLGSSAATVTAQPTPPRSRRRAVLAGAAVTAALGATLVVTALIGRNAGGPSSQGGDLVDAADLAGPPDASAAAARPDAALPDAGVPVDAATPRPRPDRPKPTPDTKRPPRPQPPTPRPHRPRPHEPAPDPCDTDHDGVPDTRC